MSYQKYVIATINEMKLRGYSPRTIQSYSQHLKSFLAFTKKSIDSLVADDVKTYLLYLVDKNLSTAYINSSYSVCRLFYKFVLKRPFSLSDIPRVKKHTETPYLYVTI